MDLLELYVYDVPIQVGSLVIPLNLEVLPNPPYDLIVGNNWFLKTRATISYDLSNIHVQYRNKTDSVPISFTRQDQTHVHLLSGHSLLKYLQPEIEDTSAELLEEDEADDIESEHVDESMDEVSSVQTQQTASVLKQDFYCMATKDETRITFDQNDHTIKIKPGPTLIIPAK